MFECWNNFNKGNWCKNIDVHDFISKNYKPYTGDEEFLVGTSNKTKKVWDKCQKLITNEILNKTISVDLENISGIDNFKPGYIDKDNEVIVGLQTDEALKRIINPYGGIRMVKDIFDYHNMELSESIYTMFNKYTKTHNQGVFDSYTKEIRLARKAGLITGLPDSYGRGRIIGDYRRVALYGVNYLIEEKIKDFNNIHSSDEESIRLREEISDQVRALNELKSMALKYGYDISMPATNSKEAVQWLYFAYLGAVKENNGAAMSLGRTSTFLDIYFERDLSLGKITEEEIQELVDQFIIKLRLVRHLRTEDYNELFAGDPTWVTESIGGMNNDGKTLVTKTSYRYLHTLDNLGSAPEPNLTVLWSTNLPEAFKKYCGKMSIKSGSIQYENDDLMSETFGNDYAISCCVSAMKVGKQMQYFGARCNLAKTLLYTINGGFDEMKNIKILDEVPFITDNILNYDKVMSAYRNVIAKVASTYVDAMNIIHYMHDKYAYEASQMALHDTNVERLMAFGVAGLSVVADSLSAIKYAKVTPIRNENNIAIDFKIEGDFPKYGNDDDRVDSIAVDIVKIFYEELKKNKLYRNAIHTLSVLTITSNVVYGSKTGATPDGRKSTVAFAPGANPMHGRDTAGALASLNSVAKLPYKDACLDGISNTFSIVPNALGKDIDTQAKNLSTILDGYFSSKAHHINVNVLDKQMLIDAMNNPEKYPMLTIRVSGYAVHFNRLTKVQQEEVIARTFHEKL
ncbi:MAG: formate C-acetyltransferase [Tenericutes bacterium]|nr:formate C-acetyltransferase [Mycoplasmatota bacterium]